MDLRRLTPLIRRWLPLMLVAAALTGAAGYTVSSLQAKTYESKATLIVGQSLSAVNPDYSDLLVSQSLAATYASIAKTTPILDRVIERLGLEADDDIASRIGVEALPDSSLLEITADDHDPALAASLANALATELIDASPALQGREGPVQASINEQLTATLSQISAADDRLQVLAAEEERTPQQDAEIQALEGRLASLRSTYATLLGFSSTNASNLLAVVDPAVASSVPVAPRPLLDLLLAAVLGLLIAAVIAFAVEQLNDSIKDPTAVRAATRLNTLGTIGRMEGGKDRREIYRLATLLYPRSGVAEAYRALRTGVDFASVDKPIRTLLVTSAVPGEGKTVTAGNLAVVMAQADRRVLLVDADLRKPGAQVLFNLPNMVGLSTLMQRDSTLTIDDVIQTTEQANLRVLTTGPLPPNPAELLGSERMRTQLEMLAKRHDLVVIDSPPLLSVTDAAVLGSYVDGTLLVVDARKSHRRYVREARETLERVGAHVLGVVLNRAESGRPSAYGGFYESDTAATARAGGAAPADAPVDMSTQPRSH